MKPSSTRKKISRSAAKNALLLNLFATPGFGSLVARRWLAGGGQLALALTGFTMFCVWAVKVLVEYYGLMFGNVQERPLLGWMGLAGTGIFAFSWLWSLVTGFSLLREASGTDLQSLESFAASQVKLDEGQIQTALATTPNWEKRGDTISRLFQFKDFPGAVKFVNAVADLAEKANHHPDIDIRWNKVTLVLTTHDAGGLTAKDFALARQFNELSLR